MGMLQQQQMYSGRMLPRQMSMPGMSVVSMVFIQKNLHPILVLFCNWYAPLQSGLIASSP
jgi:hypothetical protein